MNPYAAVLAACAAGALASWWLHLAMLRRRSPIPSSDEELLERVRARLPGLVSRPEAVQVSVQDRVVRVAGRLPPEEVERFLMDISHLPGVRKVHNALSTGRKSTVQSWSYNDSPTRPLGSDGDTSH